jgi:hypothetical protein
MKATKEQLTNAVALLGMMEVILLPSHATHIYLPGLQLLYQAVGEIEIDEQINDEL